MKLISPSIPADLLEPVPVPDRETKTLKDFGLLVVDYDQSLKEANSKIAATSEIVGKFNERIASAK